MAKDIAARFGTTTYHSDYVFKKNSHHFWLTQNGVGIINSAGLAGVMWLKIILIILNILLNVLLYLLFKLL